MHVQENKILSFLKRNCFNLVNIYLLIILVLSIVVNLTTQVVVFPWWLVATYAFALLLHLSTAIFVDIKNKENYVRKPNTSPLYRYLGYVLFFYLLLFVLFVVATLISTIINKDFDFIILFISLGVNLSLLFPVGLIISINLALSVRYFYLSSKGIRLHYLYEIDKYVEKETIYLNEYDLVYKDKFEVVDVLPIETVSLEEVDQIISNMVSDENDEFLIPLQDYFLSSKKIDATNVAHNNYLAKTFSTGMTYILGDVNNLEIDNKKTVLAKCEEYTSKGYKVLVLAKGNGMIKGDSYIGGSRLVAYIIMFNNIKIGVTDAVDYLNKNEYDLKLVSNNNYLYLSEIANKTGVKNYKHANELSDEEKKEAYAALNNENNEDMSRIPTLIREGSELLTNLRKVFSLYITRGLFLFAISVVFLFLKDQKLPLDMTNLLIADAFIFGVSSFFILLEPNKKYKIDNLIKDTAESAIPCALYMIVGVVACYVAYYLHISGNTYTGIEDSLTARNIAIFITSLLSLVVLYFHLNPLHKYRYIAFGTVFVVVAMFYLTAIFLFKDNNIFGIDFNKMLPIHYLVVGIIFVALSAILLLFKSLANTFKGEFESDQD